MKVTITLEDTDSGKIRFNFRFDPPLQDGVMSAAADLATEIYDNLDVKDLVVSKSAPAALKNKPREPSKEGA